MERTNIMRPTEVIAKLQSKTAKQAKEISRLRDENFAIKNDLADIKEQRDKLKREVDHMADHFRNNAKNTLVMLEDMGKL